ncbi:MAG: hypothetical protein NZ523_15010, partial [Elioraea sp.]|nr:hypothetical protein [Elioraea sp.]
MLSSLFALSLAVALLALLAALALLLGALGRLRRLRLGAVATRMVAAVLLALLASGAGLVAFGLAGYRPLLAETEVARVAVRAVGPERWLVQLTDGEGRVRSIPLVGDQWRLEGRVLRFRGVVGLLGVAPVYRLERLSGRFSDPAREPEAAASAVAL